MSKKAGRSEPSIWYSRSAVPTALGIAAQLGWLDAAFNGTGVTLGAVQESTDPNILAAHVDHHLPNVLRQGGSVPAMWARSQGADTRVIGLTWTDEFQVLLALRDSGIKTAKDLRGRRLGLPLRTQERIDMSRATALRGYLSVLEHNGLSYRDVRLVDVAAQVTELRVVEQSPAFVDLPQGHRTNRGYSADIRALLQKEVDVIYVKGVRGVEVARLLGDRAIVAVDIGGNPDTRWRSNNATPRPLTVSGQLLREHPEYVTRLLQQIVAVGPWAQEHQQEALALLSRETGSPGEWVNFAYGIDLRLATDLSENNIVALEEFKDFLFQWGFLRDNFSVREWIDPQPLFEVAQLEPRKSA